MSGPKSKKIRVLLWLVILISTVILINAILYHRTHKTNVPRKCNQTEHTRPADLTGAGHHDRKNDCIFFVATGDLVIFLQSKTRLPATRLTAV